jgi:hypothetical protein
MAVRSKSSSRKTEAQPPAPPTGWTIGDRFEDIRGRRWEVIGFVKSAVGTLLKAKCIGVGYESNISIHDVGMFDTCNLTKLPA